jgi:hypothetical protein
MRRIAAITFTTLSFSFAGAQTPTILGGGTAVGQPVLAPIGQSNPSVAPQVGQKIGTPPGTQQPTNTMPPGFQFDLKNVAAPIDPAFLPPALRPAPTQSLFDSAFQKWLQAFGLSKPPEQKVTFTPGMSRRNRERHREWWRD